MSFKPIELELIEDHSQLIFKQEKLRVFMSSNAFLAMDPKDQELIEDQWIATRKLQNILASRIYRFKEYPQ